MASLPVPADDARELIATHELDDVHIAAHNSPTTTVIAGNLDQVHALVQACRAQNIRARAIDVDYASHTTHVEALRDELTSQLAHIIPRAGDPTIAFHSTLQGAHVPDTTTLTTDYWINNLRHPVLFHQTIHDLYVEGHTHYIEASPHPVLTIGLHNTLEPLDSGYTVIPTLRRGTVDTHTFATALATAHTHGLSPHWDPPATPVDLPTYPFQHQRYWVNETSAVGGTVHPPYEGPLDAAVTEPTPSAPAPASDSALAQRLAAEASPGERSRILHDLVRTQVSIVLGHATSETVDSHLPFKELGFDSLAAVEFRDRLNRVTGLTLPTTLTFDHPTPTAVMNFLRAKLLAEDSHRAAAEGQLVSGGGGLAGVADDPVVIVGMVAVCRVA